MRRLLTLALTFLLPALSFAQAGPVPGGSGGGSSTITSGTTATSGCVAGGVLRSISNLVECGAGLTYAANVLTLDGGSANSGVELFYQNSSIAGIRAGTGQAYLRLGFGTAGLIPQRQDGGVFYGIWNGTGLRAGDATAPTAAFEVTNLAAAKGIMTLYDNTTPVLTVADGGATTFASQITTNGGINLGNQNLTSAGGYINFGSDFYGIAMLGSNITAGGIFQSLTTTPDTWFIATNPLSESVHFAQRGDYNYDFQNGACGTSACTDPAFIIHSAVQDTTQYNHMAVWGQAGGAVKALTESSATALVRIPVANNGRASGILYYEIYSTDGTDMQTRTSSIRYAMSNKAGTETCTLTAMDGVAATAETDDDNASDITAGTLTYGIACTNNAADTMDITFNAVSSLTQTTLQATWSLKHLSPGQPLRQ